MFPGSANSKFRHNLKTKNLHLPDMCPTELLVTGATTTTAIRDLRQSFSVPLSFGGWAWHYHLQHALGTRAERCSAVDRHILHTSTRRVGFRSVELKKTRTGMIFYGSVFLSKPWPSHVPTHVAAPAVPQPTLNDLQPH